MRGDALASGQRTATFVGPKLHFTEGELRRDLLDMSKDDFMAKYMVAEREYNMLNNSRPDEEKISAFAEEMQQRADIYNRQLATEKAQEDTLRRDCFLTPFLPVGVTGRVIVSRDGPVDKPSKILIPKSMRTDKTLLPTTGHVIKESICSIDGLDGQAGFYTLMGKRILFSPMSGTAICFKGYPTWIQLELTEILAIVNKEDAVLQDETLEPMV
jgi:hypothetical protein